MTLPNEQLIETIEQTIWMNRLPGNTVVISEEKLRALLEENDRLTKRLETMADKAAESFELAVESARELEQVKAERECLRSALEDVADYQHRWSDSPIREVQKIARSILSQYRKGDENETS